MTNYKKAVRDYLKNVRDICDQQHEYYLSKNHGAKPRYLRRKAQEREAKVAYEDGLRELKEGYE